MDFEDNNYGGAVWSSIECNIGVVCACLPAFKPFLDQYFPSLMGHSRGRSKTTPTGSSTSNKRTYMRRLSDSAIELDNGDRWKESYSARLGNQTNHVSAGTGGGGPYLYANGDGKDMRTIEAPGNTSAILKSTRIVVEHDDV